MSTDEDIPLRALRLLVAVARTGSLGAAARDLGVTQPTASEQLRRLEARTGLTLVDRSPRGSRPTEEGALLVRWAQEVLEPVDRLTAGVEALRRERSGRLRVAASQTVAEHLVPRWLVAARDALTGVAVALQVANSRDVVQAVRAGDADLGFVESPGPPAGLRSRTVRTDHLVVVVPPGHPWVGRTVTAAELAATPLVRREAGSGARDTLDHALRHHGPLAPAVVEVSSSTAVTEAVLAGAGPAAVSDLAVAEHLASGRLVAVPVEGQPLRRRLRAVWAQHRPPQGPAAALLAAAGGRVTP